MPREFTSLTFTKALRTREAYAVLGDSLNSWTQGGCWALAQALRNWIGPRAALYCVLGRPMPVLGPRSVAHVLVRVGDWYLDADGIDEGSERVRHTWSETERLHDVAIETFLPRYRMTAKRNGLVCPPAAVKRVEEFLQKRFGDGEAAVAWMRGQEVRPNPHRATCTAAKCNCPKFRILPSETITRDQGGLLEPHRMFAATPAAGRAALKILVREFRVPIALATFLSAVVVPKLRQSFSMVIEIGVPGWAFPGTREWLSVQLLDMPGNPFDSDVLEGAAALEFEPQRFSGRHTLTWTDRKPELRTRSNPNSPTADAIYRAMGGKAAFAAIGSKSFTQGPDWLMFTHSPAPKNRAHATRITRHGSDWGRDTYLLEFYAKPPHSARGVHRNAYVVGLVKDVFVDQLVAVFESRTGLSLQPADP